MNPGAALARRWLALPPRRCAVRHEIQWVALADGTRLATSVWLPSDHAASWPSVLIRTTSPAHDAADAVVRMGRLVAESGYAVAIQECRGRHASEGRFAPYVHEAADGADAIAWLTRQPWCDGRVALIGWGYSGFAAWAALSRSAQPIAAFAAVFAARDPYALLRPGGAFALERALAWGVGIGEREPAEARSLDLARGLLHRPLREADRVTHRRVDWFREWILHPLRDDYWQARTPALPSSPPPSLLVAGWRHPALAAQLADHAALQAAAQRSGAPAPELVVGPWPGGQPKRARATRSEPGAGPLREVIDFLARRLRGESVPRARVRVFVRGEASWRESSAWPLPETETRAYFLRGGGSANGRAGDGALLLEAAPGSEPADRFVFDPRDPVLADDAGAECRADVLCYTSERLALPITLAGPVSARLFVTSSAAVTDFTASLAQVAEGGSAEILCEGVLRSAGAPGGVRALELELGAACARIEAGARLRLAVSSSAFPRWDTPSHTDVEAGLAREDELASAEQSLRHDREHPSLLRLPLLRS